MAPWKRILLKSAGFGTGFAITISIIFGFGIWYSNRPKPWSDSALTSKWTELSFQQQSEELHMDYQYALTNHTNTDYTLPAPPSGALMRKIPQDASLAKLDTASWDSTIRIPPNQAVNVVFEIVYKFTNFNTSAAQLYGSHWSPDATGLDATPELLKFAGTRMKEIDGMAFLDYTNRYRIDLPKQLVKQK